MSYPDPYPYTDPKSWNQKVMPTGPLTEFEQECLCYESQIKSTYRSLASPWWRFVRWYGIDSFHSRWLIFRFRELDRRISQAIEHGAIRQSIKNKLSTTLRKIESKSLAQKLLK